jgi:hypothetical protein
MSIYTEKKTYRNGLNALRLYIFNVGIFYQCFLMVSVTCISYCISAISHRNYYSDACDDKLSVNGRQQNRYSVIAITLYYVYDILHNASILRRKVIASFRYRSGLIEIVVASNGYQSNLIGIVIGSYSYCIKIAKSLSLHITSLRFSLYGINLTSHARW